MVEGLLPDSQCGFQKGQGCVDMIFVAREDKGTWGLCSLCLKNSVLEMLYKGFLQSEFFHEG